MAQSASCFYSFPQNKTACKTRFDHILSFPKFSQQPNRRFQIESKTKQSWTYKWLELSRTTITIIHRYEEPMDELHKQIEEKTKKKKRRIMKLPFFVNLEKETEYMRDGWWVVWEILERETRVSGFFSL